MRLRVFSDLHLEFGAYEPPPLACDAVILAGDIHQGTAGLQWARRHFPHETIVYVPGNHEYYGHDWNELAGDLRQAAARMDIHLLDRASMTLAGVRFLGCTLWTDFDLFGAEQREAAMAACARTLHDYRHIRSGGRCIAPAQTRDRHLRDRAWLEGELARAAAGAWRATVVVTHMVPSDRSTAERYRSQALSAGFASHLDALVEGADLWIHGHTHDSYDYALGKCRVICNPRGYPHVHRSRENSGYEECKLVVI